MHRRSLLIIALALIAIIGNSNFIFAERVQERTVAMGYGDGELTTRFRETLEADIKKLATP